MSRNPWLTLEAPTTSPWEQLRAAKVRKAQAEVNDDGDMEPDPKKNDDDDCVEPDPKKNDDDEDMGPAEGPSPSEKPAMEPAAAFGCREPASVTPTIEMATMDDLNRRFDSMESRFERLFEKNTRLTIQRQDDTTKKLDEKIDEVACFQEKFVNELQRQQADTSAKFESLTARLAALEKPVAAAAPAAARPPSTASAPRGRTDPWVEEDPWRNHRVGREAAGSPAPRPAASTPECSRSRASGSPSASASPPPRGFVNTKEFVSQSLTLKAQGVVPFQMP